LHARQLLVAQFCERTEVIIPFCAELRKTEEQRQYKTPLNSRHLIVRIAGGTDVSGSFLRSFDSLRSLRIILRSGLP